MNTTFADLPATSGVIDTSIFPAEKAGYTERVTGLQLKSYLAHNTPSVAYVETTGNDSTASPGDPSRPFATLQAAFNALLALGGTAGYLIKMGIGTWTVNVPAYTDWPSRIQLAGAGVSLTFLTVTGTDGDADTNPYAGSLFITDAIGHSFTGTYQGANLGGSGGGDGSGSDYVGLSVGSVTLVNCSGATASGGGVAWSGTGGSVTLTGCKGFLAIPGGGGYGFYGYGSVTMVDSIGSVLNLSSAPNNEGTISMTGCTYQAIVWAGAENPIPFNDYAIDGNLCAISEDGTDTTFKTAAGVPSSNVRVTTLP